MRVKTKKIFLFSMLLCVTVFGCNQIQPTSSNLIKGNDPKFFVSTSMAVDNALGRTSTPLPFLPGKMVTPETRPTLTFVPGLEGSKAKEKVIQLLNNNGGCHLPCYWGFTPGESDIQAFRSRSYEFWNITPETFLFGEKGGGIGILLTEKGVQLENAITAVMSTESSTSVIRRIEVRMRAYQQTENEKKLQYGNPDFLTYFQYYNLFSLLSRYGMPDNTYMEVIPGSEVGMKDEFYLYLDYSKMGWSATIQMPAQEAENHHYQGCPYVGFTTLELWKPGDKDMEKVYGFQNRVRDHGLYTLEEGTFITKEIFYENFKDPTYMCVESKFSKSKN